MPDNSWRARLKQGFNDAEELGDFIDELLADAKREGARRVIEDMTLGECPYGEYDEEVAGWFEAQDKLEERRKQLRSKYLTPTGNLDQ